ncbi:hypothetical protein D0869_12643 [Hortaea werneckii]|uniref:RRM domain-containing protein n=1 Tax=Hortaea werneckii TaxID=91943 RepID=A0A3M6W7V8_HORWE|nr:hypothetical protein D0869_12643 [Hortaea werneckii]
MADRPNGRRSPTRSATPRSTSRNSSPSRSPSRSRSRSRSNSRGRNRRTTRSLTRSPTHSSRRTPSPPHRSTKIVIEKLTKNIHPAHLHEIFSLYGPIADLEMPMNRQFLMNKGIAYILYTSAKDAEEAIACMHEAQLDGACINVSIVLPRRRFSRSPPGKRPPPNRFGEPHRLRDGPGGGGGGGGGRGPPPMSSDRVYRPGAGAGPPPGGRRGGRGGGGGGYRDRYDDRDSYRPRSYSASPPPPRRRGGGGRSPSYDSRDRSLSRSPPPPASLSRRRYDSPPPARGGRGRRSPSYSSYGSRSRSPSRDRGGRRR